MCILLINSLNKTLNSLKTKLLNLSRRMSTDHLTNPKMTLHSKSYIYYAKFHANSLQMPMSIFAIDCFYIHMFLFHIRCYASMQFLSSKLNGIIIKRITNYKTYKVNFHLPKV